MTETATVKPLKYHGPGWTLEVKDDEGYAVEYLVWAPNLKRDHWAACWQMHQGIDGNYLNGPDLETVLTIFPEAIAVEFRKAIS